MVSGKGGNVRIIRSLPAIIAAILITAAPAALAGAVYGRRGLHVGVAAAAAAGLFTAGQRPTRTISGPPATGAGDRPVTTGCLATWVAPPSVGVYWTPGYWGYRTATTAGTRGYWGPSVGFYGGVNYGFGYFGTGFVGGFWAGKRLPLQHGRRERQPDRHPQHLSTRPSSTTTTTLSRELQRRPRRRLRTADVGANRRAAQRPRADDRSGAIRRKSRPRIATSTRTSTRASRRLRRRRNRSAIRSSSQSTRR